MWVSDHIVSEMTIRIDDRLSDRRSTDMSDMQRFSHIGTDIVDDYRLPIWWFLICTFSHLFEYIEPYLRCSREVHIATHDICLSEVPSIFSELRRDLFGDHSWRFTEWLRERKYPEAVLSELTFRWNWERDGEVYISVERRDVWWDDGSEC